MAGRGHELPPPARAVTDYLTYLALYRGNVGALSDARGALLHLYRVNSWTPAPYREGAPTVPMAAMRRICRHRIRKTAGLSWELVRAILERLAWPRPGRDADLQWELALGCAIVTAYKLMARYDELAQLRWEAAFCQVEPERVQFWVETRKTHQEGGDVLDVARPFNPSERGVYHAILDARRVAGGRGFVLPRIAPNGQIDRSHPMPYASYVRLLRRVLISMGADPAAAQQFAGHSAWAGAATASAQAGNHPERIALAAGVQDISWILGYNRASLHDRLLSSWTLGL